MEMGLGPVLCKSKVCELDAPTITLPKLRKVAERLSAVPVPLSATVCGLLAALSETLNEAVRKPCAVGRKLTLTVQFAPTASVEPQGFVIRKSPGFAPVRVMLFRSRI